MKGTCNFCGRVYNNKKSILKRGKKRSNTFCSDRCHREWDTQHQTVSVKCGNCHRNVRRVKSQHTKSKSGFAFCSKSCAATYNNTHKTKGTRRSKMEVFLEKSLRSCFPKLTILFNDKTAIGSELDFYFPDLKLAIEVNGILHYEPIYGDKKFEQIKNNDQRKLIACYEKGIELVIIPTTKKYMTTKMKEEYWTEVSKIIKMRL